MLKVFDQGVTFQLRLAEWHVVAEDKETLCRTCPTRLRLEGQPVDGEEGVKAESLLCPNVILNEFLASARV